ncbi:MAG TPA: carbohydrate binding domain-containing protein [Pyrinomonadaceae bacterium]|nr:carbohydrate binding domain-containing protein [Pyrinomonadaceae bacterium]
MKAALRFLSHRSVRFLLVAIGIGICLWMIQSTAGLGLSRLLGRYALAMGDLEAARTAIQLAPNDAQAHRNFSTISNLVGASSESLVALEKAVALRPKDYSLWIALGLTRDQMGNTVGALAAFDEAIRHAPFYSRPRWQRGNVLLRAGQYEAAFKDLNQAAQSNPELIPRVIDLAWSLSQRDPALTEKLAQIQTPKMRIAFAKLLAREGKASEAVAQLKAAGNIGDEIRGDLIQELLTKESYGEAYEVWKSGVAGAVEGTAAIYDGGFEGPLTLNERGFGWRVAGESKGHRFSLDSTDRNSGTKSLLINFQGESASPLLSQLVMVEPSGRYKVNFAARSKDIVSGGPPLAVVTDPSSRERLGQSTTLVKGGDGWQTISFAFTAAPKTNAVVISVERESCTTSPCPIFGSLWLDSFSMERVK